MSLKPITNHTANDMHVGAVVIPPGETKLFEESELPPHLRDRKPAAPPAVKPADTILEILDGTVKEIEKAVEERDADGHPVLSDDQLVRLKQAEENGNTRKGVIGAIDQEWLKRADEMQKREDLAVFAEQLKAMPAEQLEQLKETHKEDPERLAAIEAQQSSNAGALQSLRDQVDELAGRGDREGLRNLRRALPGDVEVPAAVELIDAALAKLDDGGGA